MDAWSRIAFCVFCLSVVWCSQAQANNVSDLLYAGIAIVMLYGGILFRYSRKNVKWTTVVSLTLLWASLVLWAALNTTPWYNGFYKGPDVLLYLFLALMFVENVRCFRTVSHAYLHLSDKVYKMRACIFKCVLVFPVASAVYYVKTIFELLDAAGAPGLVESTLESSYDRKKCAEIDAADDMKYELYDVTPFTLECIGDIWERLRINMLVLVQLYIAFLLVVDIPYWLHRGISEKFRAQRASAVKEICAMLYLVECVSLFAGSTAALNEIEAWMLIDTLPAVLLTIAILSYCTRCVIQHESEKTWIMPFVDESVDPTSKSINLML